MLLWTLATVPIKHFLETDMPWLWNDKTYRKRNKIGRKNFIKIFLPLWAVIFIVWSLLNSDLSIKALFFLTILLSMTISAFFDIFLKSLHPKIPDWVQQIFRILNFMVALVLFLWLFNHRYAI